MPCNIRATLFQINHKSLTFSNADLDLGAGGREFESRLPD
mgnify:CR=1 FL=1